MVVRTVPPIEPGRGERNDVDWEHCGALVDQRQSALALPLHGGADGIVVHIERSGILRAARRP